MSISHVPDIFLLPAYRTLQSQGVIRLKNENQFLLQGYAVPVKHILQLRLAEWQ